MQEETTLKARVFHEYIGQISIELTDSIVEEWDKIEMI